MNEFESVRHQVRDEVWVHQLNGPLRSSVWDEMRQSAREYVWNRVREQIIVQLRNQVWGQVGEQAQYAIWRKVCDKLRVR